METRIPKIIHYCWFGGKPKPQLILNCIESWKRFCPDYRIIEWNEDNFDIHSSTFVEEAYQAGKWAFVADYVRAQCLLQYGGIYLDTDMEIIRPIDPLLNRAFFAGFEVRDTVAAGVIGCEKDSAVIQRYAEYYRGKHFFRNDIKDATTSPVVITEILTEKGLKLNGRKQFVSDCMIYPKSTFYPTGLRWVLGKYGPKTIAVHHYMDSWGYNKGMGERSRSSKLRLCLLYHARNILGTNAMYRLGKKIRERKHK